MKDTKKVEERFDDLWHEEDFAQALHEYAASEGYENRMTYAPEKYQILKAFIREVESNAKAEGARGVVEHIDDLKAIFCEIRAFAEKEGEINTYACQGLDLLAQLRKRYE